MEEKKKNEGLRYNDGKTRHDLLPAYGINEIAKVLTFGADKYADRNWELGMKWSKVLASLKRHINAFESGEDFDKETGLSHMAHAATNALFLVEYTKTYPQGDDRPHSYLNPPKIGLDIDEVIADWVTHWTTHHNMDIPEFWNFDTDIKTRYKELQENKEFWLSIPPKISPADIPFEPHCYITSRGIPDQWTREWLDKHKFPAVPLYTVGPNESKVKVAEESGIEWFVDDRYENFVELNNAGICCFLLDAPHNKRYNVGYKRIKSLQELIK